MLRLAIREDMLPGQSVLELFEHTAALGVAGIELIATDLDNRMEQIVDAMAATGIEIAAINHGRRDGILHVSPDEREHALAALRQSICDAADLGASGVVFAPNFGALSIPDLTPFLSAEGLAAELLLSHLRTLEDYAAAMGVKLFIRSLRREESVFLYHLADAAAVARKRNHPAIRVATSTIDLLDEGVDIPAALRAGGDVLGHVYVSDARRDELDFAAVAAALEAINYDGWVTLEGRAPRAEQTTVSDLSGWVAALRASGFA